MLSDYKLDKYPVSLKVFLKFTFQFLGLDYDYWLKYIYVETFCSLYLVVSSDSIFVKYQFIRGRQDVDHVCIFDHMTVIIQYMYIVKVKNTGNVVWSVYIICIYVKNTSSFWFGVPTKLKYSVPPFLKLYSDQFYNI